MVFIRVALLLVVSISFVVSHAEQIAFGEKDYRHILKCYNYTSDRIEQENKYERDKKVFKREKVRSLTEYATSYVLRPIDSFWNIARDAGNIEYDPEKLKFLTKASQSLIDEIQYYVPFTGASYCKSGFDNCSYCEQVKYFIITINDKETGTKAIVIHNEDKEEIIVAYRGSEGFSKFVKAAAIVKSSLFDVPGAFVQENHKFYVDKIQSKISALIKSRLETHKIKRLVLLGHSLGGSLAALAAPLMACDLNLSPKQIRVITYGQPRSGNEIFARWYNSIGFNFTRVVNYKDPIASHPPYEEGWSHVNTEVFIADDKQYYICNSTRLEHRDCSLGKATRMGIIYSHRYVGDTALSSRAC